LRAVVADRPADLAPRQDHFDGIHERQVTGQVGHALVERNRRPPLLAGVE
jgi:hypothetical protein